MPIQRQTNKSFKYAKSKLREKLCLFHSIFSQENVQIERHAEVKPDDMKLVETETETQARIYNVVMA